MTEQLDTQDTSGAQAYPEQIDLLQQVMTNQQNTIDELVARVAGLETRLGERGEPAADASKPKPLDWSATSLTLSQRATLFAELTTFVDDLVSRHNLQDRIRPCWWRHGAAVEELTALWTARQVALATTADASMLSWWQDLLDRSASRLRRIFVKCRKAHVGPETVWMSQSDRAALEQEIDKRRTAAVALAPVDAGDPQRSSIHTVEIDAAGGEQDG